MSPEERNYPVADKEMLSVIRSLEQWRHYLEGAHHEFEIWNDHANLQWFMKHQDLNRRQARWAQYLSRFNFKWLHKAGATMGKADALSRREDHSIGIQGDYDGGLFLLDDKRHHHEFEIWNDHAYLQWFMKHQDLNRRQARWAQYLSRFNFKWLHKAGATMGKADALSRREDHSIGIERDNTGILVIPPDQIRSVTEVRIATDADIIIDTIKDILYDLKEPDLIPLRKQYILKDRIFYDENVKIYVPEN
jgi:hypothetical protein